MATPSAPPPAHARPFHNIPTPRLILRSAVPSDAAAFAAIRSDPANNPFGGVRNATFTVEQQRETLSKQAGSTARGENGFLVIVLREGRELPKGLMGQDEEILRVDDGVIIGMTGYNMFTYTRRKEGGEEVLESDTGVLVDHHFVRRGYATEAMEAVMEYGFNELGCAMISLETELENRPFRAVMDSVGLGSLQVQKKGGSYENDGLDSYYWGVYRDVWNGIREDLKAKGKWFLE